MAVLPDNKKPQPTSVSPVKPQRKGTGFTNLARVMQASQGSKLGQTIAGGLTGQAQQVQSGIKTAQEEFQKEAEKNRVDTEANRAKAATAITQAGTTGIVNPEDLNLFKTIRAAEYKGPTELANQQQLQAQAQQAQTLGSLASGIGQRSGTDQGGRQELLRRFAGGSDYTSGQRKLDESILSKDKESNLASAARQTRGVVEEAQRAAIGAQAKGQEYGSLAKIFAKETQSKIGEAQQPISSEVNKSVAQANKTAEFLNKLKTQTQLSSYSKLSSAEKESKLIADINEGVSNNLIPKEVANKLIGESGLGTVRAKLIGESSDLVNSLDQIAGSNAWWRLKNFTNLAYDRSTNSVANNTPNTIRKYIAELQNKDLYNDAISTLTQDSNISRQSLASDEQISRLNALDQLYGKTGADLEFGQNVAKYKGVSADTDPYLKQLYTSQSDKLKTAENIGKWHDYIYGKGTAGNTRFTPYGGDYQDWGTPQMGEYIQRANVPASVQYQTMINQRSRLDQLLKDIDARASSSGDADLINQLKK